MFMLVLLPPSYGLPHAQKIRCKTRRKIKRVDTIFGFLLPLEQTENNVLL